MNKKFMIMLNESDMNAMYGSMKATVISGDAELYEYHKRQFSFVQSWM